MNNECLSEEGKEVCFGKSSVEWLVVSRYHSEITSQLLMHSNAFGHIYIHVHGYLGGDNFFVILPRYTTTMGLILHG